MIDPHVVSLTYKVESGPAGPVYENPPPVVVNRPEFTLELQNGRAVVTMKVHCARLEEAQELVNSFLEAWEIDSALRQRGTGWPQLLFSLEDSKIIDRNPPLPGTYAISAGVGTLVLSGVALGIAEIVTRQYPPAPRLLVDADVRTLWFRYSLYKEGRDSLTGVGYFCLSYLLWLGHGAKGARQVFSVDEDVLDKLSELTSGVGDQATARKRHAKMEWRAHTTQELQWIDATIRALIRHVGEHAAGVPLQLLTMADLPPLE